jgi:ribosome-associated translation inhibitor RaiA
MRRNLVAFHWRPSLRARALPRQFNSTIRAESTQASRIDRITSKLPRRLQKYTSGLRNAPVSHIVSFLILHEITAIVPVLGLFGLFHYTNYVPVDYVTGHFGTYVEDGVGRFERYFKRKGWFGFGQNEEVETTSDTATTHPDSKSENAVERWHSGDGRYKVLVEVALAYAITKALLPVRIIGSVWATPWFAGVLMRAKGVFTRKP